MGELLLQSSRAVRREKTFPKKRRKITRRRNTEGFLFFMYAYVETYTNDENVSTDMFITLNTLKTKKNCERDRRISSILIVASCV